MRALLFLPLLAVTGCAPKVDTIGAPRAEAVRDLEGYAIASCLTYQAKPYLKDQGDAWASVIVQRTKGNLDTLADIAEQVKGETDKGNMATIRDETGAAQDKTLPVLFCGEIIDSPTVRAAIQKAAAELE